MICIAEYLYITCLQYIVEGSALHVACLFGFVRGWLRSCFVVRGVCFLIVALAYNNHFGSIRVPPLPREMADGHVFSMKAFIGGDDSFWEGPRREVPKCAHCMAFLCDNGEVKLLDDPDKERPKCPRKEIAKVTGGKRSRSTRKDGGSSDDANSDSETLDYSLPEKAISVVLGKPLSVHRGARLVASGSAIWMSDPTTIPPTGTETGAAVVRDPDHALLNACIFDEIVAARELALILDQCGDRKFFEAKDEAGLGRIFQGSTAGTPTRGSLLQDAFVRLVRSIGRRARLLRLQIQENRKQKGKHEGDSLKVVPDARAAGGMTDPATYVRRERVEDLVNQIDRLGSEEGLLSLDNAENDTDFIIGAVLCGCAFDADMSARHVWRAVSDLDRRAAASIRRDHKDEIAAAKEKRKDEHIIATVLRARGVAGGGDGAGGAASGGTQPPRNPGTPTGAGTPTGGAKKGRPSARARRLARQAAAAAQANGGGGGATTGAAAGGQDPALALPPAKRDDDAVFRLRLCRRCREPGHQQKDCQKPAVTFSG